MNGVHITNINLNYVGQFIFMYWREQWAGSSLHCSVDVWHSVQVDPIIKQRFYQENV